MLTDKALSLPWWHPIRHGNRRPFLLLRNRLKTRIRDFFNKQDFLEVESSCLMKSTCGETHLHAFPTTLVQDGMASQRYLQTSPELSMKKLIAGGETKIFEFAKAWRNREKSKTHHPEFTMLEWYKVGSGYEDLITDCCNILRLAAAEAGVREISFAGRSIDPEVEPEIITVAEAFQRYAKIDLLSTISPDTSVDRDKLATAAANSGVQIEDNETWSAIFSRILVDLIEPNLGLTRVTALTEYPISEAVSSLQSSSDQRVANRVEIFACGLELANGCEELTDPVEQTRRFRASMKSREQIYGDTYPIDDDFISALSFMPATSGMALGFDRLVMLISGATNIEEVLWVPLDQAAD